MRQFLLSAGRTIFKTRGLYAARRPGLEPQQSHGGFGSNIKSADASIAEKARIKGADRQASQYDKAEAMENKNMKQAPLQDAGIGINQSDATAKKNWTETAKEQTVNSFERNKRQEQLLRDFASGKSNPIQQSKEWQELAEKQRGADERAAKYPTMPKQDAKNIAPERIHSETDKITSIINEEHGIPDVLGQKSKKSKQNFAKGGMPEPDKKPSVTSGEHDISDAGEGRTQNTSPGFTDSHEQHGAHLKGDDMVFRHQPKMRFDPARSHADNSVGANDQYQDRRAIRDTADHQRMEKKEDRIVDSMRLTGDTAADWQKEKRGGSDSGSGSRSGAGAGSGLGSQQRKPQTVAEKQAKTEGKERVNQFGKDFRPFMGADFGIPSGSPVGAIKNPEKRSRIDPEKNTTELKH